MSTGFLYGAQDTTVPLNGQTPSGTVVGDDLYLTVGWLHATPLASTIITIPSGFTLIHRWDFLTGLGSSLNAVGSIAVYHKTATLGDIGASYSVTIGPGGSDGAVRMATVHGGYGIDLVSIIPTVRAAGTGMSTWTPAVPAGTGFARGVMIGYWPGVGGGAGSVHTANGWGASFNPQISLYTYPDATRPMPSLVLNDGANPARIVVAFAIKAVPNPWGYNLSFGQRSGL